MPPKKRIVKKTVRKTKAKASASASAAASPPADLELSSPTESLTPNTADPETPVPADTETPVPADTETPVPADADSEPTVPETSVLAGTEATVPEPASPTETAAPAADSPEKPSETAAEETLAPLPTESQTLEPEPDTAEVLAEEPAANETLEAEPVAAESLTEDPAPADEPLVEPEPAVEETKQEPSETAAKPKTVTRVRKVIKKKIVKKLVPKTPVAPKVEEKEVQEEAVASNPQEKSELVNASPDSQPEETNEEEKVDSRNAEDVVMEEPTAAKDEEDDISERRNRRKTEIFIGGLDRDAKEEDLRKVFGRVGEIVEVRMIMDGQSGKNKGYAFLRYAEAGQARKAVSEFEKVEVCGKLCGASALKGNDTIFLGNIDKKWKKEDILKLLQEIGVEKIDTVTIMTDPKNADCNRGFAFLELETNRDAQNAYKKLLKKDVFGKDRNIKVSWAEPLNDPDEEEMKKVKSVYAESIPSSWSEEKVRESFKKFGEIERVVLARNIKSAKRKDFAFVNYKTRESALLCVESFDKEGLIDAGKKVNIKVSLAKPVQKGKQNAGASKTTSRDNAKDKIKPIQRDAKANSSLNMGKFFKGGHTTSDDKKSSTTHELLHVLREQATWKQGQVGYAGGPTMHGYAHGELGPKRPFSALADEALYSDLRGYPRARLDTSFPSAGSSYGAMHHGMAGSYPPPHYQHPGAGYAGGHLYGATDYAGTNQMRQGPPPPYGSSYYRY